MEPRRRVLGEPCKRAEPLGSAPPPGTVLDEAPRIACGEGALRLLRLQRPGRGALDAEPFLRGYPLPRGTVLD